MENDRWEGASRSPGHAENFAHRIRLWHPECTGSIPKFIKEKKNSVVAFCRFHFHSARQRIADGRWSLRRSRLLFPSHPLQRNRKANNCVGRFINWMPSVHSSKKKWQLLTESIVFKFHLFILLVRLQLRTTRVRRHRLWLVERQGRSCPVFLGREQFQRPHLSVWNWQQLRRWFSDLQLWLCGAHFPDWFR